MNKIPFQSLELVHLFLMVLLLILILQHYFFGTVVDICADDWTPGVTDATSQIEPYEEITLSKTPVPATIRVFVDQTPYSDWTYDASTNTVYFTVIPGGGSLVEVGYVVDGLEVEDSGQ